MLAKDASVPLIVTEGEKKAAAGCQAAIGRLMGVAPDTTPAQALALIRCSYRLGPMPAFRVYGFSPQSTPKMPEFITVASSPRHTRLRRTK